MFTELLISALAAAAVQLMGVGIGKAPGQTHRIHQLKHLGEEQAAGGLFRLF